MSELLTLREAAARLGRNAELVRVWVASGRLAGRKRGHMWFISERDLARFQKRSPVRRTWTAAAKRRVRRRWAERSAAARRAGTTPQADEKRRRFVWDDVRQIRVLGRKTK